MTPKERQALERPIQDATENLIEEIERLENELEDAKSIIAELEAKLATAKARIEELEKTDESA